MASIIPKRPLKFGSTSRDKSQQTQLPSARIELPVLGFPGITLCSERNADPATAKAYVHEAVKAGFTYIDVAPEYGDGVAQARLGPALQGLDRAELFLASKTMFRTAAETERDFQTTCAALQTEYLDLYQCHSVTTADDVDAILATPGGALEAMQRLKAGGKIKHIGFSAHNEEQALRLIATGAFETIMFPLNYVSYTRCGVGKRVLEAANQRGMGVIALKAMARGRLKIPSQETEPTFVGMDLSNALGGGTVGNASQIKHVPQEILRSYKHGAPVIVHQTFKTWYHPEHDPIKMRQLVRFALGLPGVTSAICPGSDDLFRTVVSQMTHNEDDYANTLTTPLTDPEVAALAIEYADADPIFHTGAGGSFVTHS